MDHLPEIVMLIRTLAYRVSSLCTTLIANYTQIKKTERKKGIYSIQHCCTAVANRRYRIDKIKVVVAIAYFANNQRM